MNPDPSASARPLRRCCEVPPPRPVPAYTRLAQQGRRLLKATLWHPLTALLDRLGLTLETVQVLCVDPTRELVLLLRTDEYRCGYCPVQGLRQSEGGPRPVGHYPPDARLDARRELGEEALREPPRLSDFHVVLRYREGPFRQFDCHVLVVDCDALRCALLPETAEGIACWTPIADAPALLDNPALTKALTKALTQRSPGSSMA